MKAVKDTQDLDCPKLGRTFFKNQGLEFLGRRGNMGMLRTVVGVSLFGVAVISLIGGVKVLRGKKEEKKDGKDDGKKDGGGGK